jgi:hypothetical protein
VRRQRIDVTNAPLQGRKIDRQLQWLAFTDTPHQLVGRVLVEKLFAQVAGLVGERLGIRTAPPAFAAVARSAVGQIELPSIGECSRGRGRKQQTSQDGEHPHATQWLPHSFSARGQAFRRNHRRSIYIT